MTGSEYHVVTRWTLEATREEIAEVFREPEMLPRWWPAAFLAVEVDRPGGLYEIGQVACLCTKGWLPYTLSFACRVIESDHPRSFTIVVEGDFEGRCVSRLQDDGSSVELEFDWRVSVRKPFVRRLSPFFKPLFLANHLWVMSRGLESLMLELRRRRAWRAGLDIKIPPPPGPTFQYLLGMRPILERRGRRLAGASGGAAVQPWRRQ